MNDIFKETFGTPNTEKQTPIEIALGVDVKGMTTATKLYQFLELNHSNYSKWFKKNITDNEFAEENVDYFPFVLQYEHGNTIGERKDAKLIASFAKKLSMMQKNQKGEAARNYFIGVENAAKKIVNEPHKVPLTEHPGEVANYLKAMDRVAVRQNLAPYPLQRTSKKSLSSLGLY